MIPMSVDSVVGIVPSWSRILIWVG